MRNMIITAILAALGVLPLIGTGELLQTAQDVRSAAYGAVPRVSNFTLNATVTFVRQEDGGAMLSVKDKTGDVALTLHQEENIPRPGMRINVHGHTLAFIPTRPTAIIDTLTILGDGPVPLPTPTSGPDLYSGRFDCQLTRITGVIQDVCRSETNTKFVFLIVNCQGQKVYVSTIASKSSFDRLCNLLDTEITADGICLPFDNSFRVNMGRIFKVPNAETIRPTGTTSPSKTPLPDIGSIGMASPSDIAMLGRHRAVGRIIAVWDGNQALLRAAHGKHSQLNFAQKLLPNYGDLIEASGLPETDMFQVNLMRSTWRRLPSKKMADDMAQAVQPEAITTVVNDTPHINRRFHGRAIRIRGRIVSLPIAESHDQRLYLANGTHLVCVKAQALTNRLSNIPVGSLVEVSGTCVMEAEVWRPNMVFTKAKGFFLVARTPDDIRVLARPSWWTTGRLVIVIAALFTLLLAILTWNISLQRLSERKGRALTRAMLARSESALKVQERTRLATELHDSIVQNLTGASLHLRAADKLYASDPDAMHEQVSIALKTIDSCRNEVRNCIWDLHNRALDEPYMDDAIRRTLAPHVEGVRLAVRFAVPRNRLTDNTAHGIICVIRELVLNALRHGKSTMIQVAGCLDGDQLLFSVKDNGTGFDADKAPGIEQGHFGLQGIRERIGQLQGDVTIVSTPGEGTKVSVSIRMPKEGKQ